ncbi:PAS domain S-box protein [Anatilimnocola sp. NA78]|uniref:hybrid sensor histidine kinase/response regulator n=1 Tax=Anatilimnocola sp. NA78 TaxID=3415683 RepID=UPI003CE52373
MDNLKHDIAGCPELDFQVLFESAPGLYLVLTPDLKIAAVSNGYLQATMTQRQSILGKDIFDVFPDNPDDPTASGVSNLRASLERVLRNNLPDAMAVQKYDIRRPVAEGGGFEERYWSPINSPVFGVGDRITYIIHRVEDVTEFVRLKQRGLEQEKLAQEMRIRGEQMEAEIFLRAQEIQVANKQLRQANDELSRIKCHLEQRVKERTADLTRMNVALTSEAFERARTEAERINQAREADRKHRLYEAALSNTPDLVYVFDLNHRFAYANEVLLRMWGKTWDEAIGKNCLELGYETWHAAMHDREIDKVVATKQPIRGEVPFTGTFGRRIYEYIFVPVLGESGEVEAVAGTTRDVTDRRQSEEQISHSEERFRSLMEQAPFSIQLFSADGRTLRVNTAWEELWGLKFEQIADYNVLEDSQLDAKGVLPSIRRAFAGEPSHVPAILYDPNETIPNRSKYQDPLRWVSAMAYPIKDETGNVREVVLVHEDITQRKNAEVALQRTEERLRLITDSLPTLISYVDSEGIYRLNNRAYEEWFRHSRNEVTGRHMRDVLGEAAWSVICEKVEAAFSGQTVHYEAEVQYKDAGKRWIDATYVPHFDNGGVVGLFVLVNDISDRKKAEEAVRKSEALFRSMADNAPAMLWVTNLTGHCTFMSAHWYEFTGRTPGKDVGYGWLEAIHPDDLDRTRRTFLSATEGQLPFSIEYRVRRHDGEYRWAVDAGLPRFEAGKFQGFVGCVFDVHERKIAEDANIRLVQELRNTDQRKDEFLATLAHELRNPLAPIRNALQILKLPRVDAETVERSREMMERQVHHLVRLVDDLLDVSRVMRGRIELRKERIELATVVARAVETVQPLMDAQGHNLNVQLPKESLLLDADPVRLTQVVGNLLTNAAKYTEANGRIWLTAERDGSEAVLKVLDSGIGISAGMLHRIFELFVQVDHATTKAQGGLGIGLTLVKNLVQLHNGSVEARSAGLGQGSEFVVRLPISAQALRAKGDSGPARSRQPILASGHRMLVVDDNQDAALSFAMLLRLQGHEVRVAHSGLAALEVTKAFVPDIVFLDIGMPGMDGYEVARQMRQLTGLENVVLAALTGWGQQEDRRRTAEAGFRTQREITSAFDHRGLKAGAV